MYVEGTGVAVDHKKSAEWYEKAAEQGHADARTELIALQDAMAKKEKG